MSLASLPTLGSAQTIMINPVEDADVTSASTMSNNGTSTALYMGSAGQIGFSGTMAFLKFANTYPTTAVLGTAYLKVYNFQTIGGGGTLSSVWDVADDSWTETGITWNNRPAYGGLLDTQGAALGSYASLNVSAYVQSQISGASSYISLALTPNGVVPNFSSTTWLRLYSREGASPPVLELNFTSIPEPSAFAGLSGLMAFAFVAYRNRRRRATT